MRAAEAARCRLKFPHNDPGKAIEELVGAVHGIAENPPGRYRCEDLISAIAAFTGEAVMRQAGDFDFDHHTLTPGQPVFSLKVNGLLSGDRSEWPEIPVTSVFGAIHNILPNHPSHPWPRESFPNVGKVYERFAAARHGGVSKDWGKAALSVPPSHYPSEGMPPLRAAYDLRRSVGKQWQSQGVSAEAIAAVAQFSLLKIMTLVRAQIEPKIGLLLAFETINSMAKTAPVLPKHMEEWVRQKSRPGLS
jgi:hypothetical protein